MYVKIHQNLISQCIQLCAYIYIHIYIHVKYLYYCWWKITFGRQYDHISIMGQKQLLLLEVYMWVLQLWSVSDDHNHLNVQTLKPMTEKKHSREKSYPPKFLLNYWHFDHITSSSSSALSIYPFNATNFDLLSR